MAGIGTTLAIYDQMTAPLNNIRSALESTNVAFDELQDTANNTFDSTSYESVKTSLSGLSDAITHAEQTQQGLNSAVEQLGHEINNNNQNQQKFTQEVDNSNNSTNQLSSTFMKLAGTIGAAFSVKKIIGLSDEMTNITSRLDLMNDGLQTTVELQDMIFQSAQRSRGSYLETADAVASLGGNAKDAFQNTQEIVHFSELLNKQFTIAGTSAEGVSAATLQLTQAMGMGTLRGEELNSVLEQAPNIVQAIADYMDEPIGKIKDLASEGLITSEIVKNAMFSAADDINAKFEEMPMTFAQIWTSFKNQALMSFQPVLQRLNDIANSQGFQTFVTNAIEWVAILAHVVTVTFEKMGQLGSWVADNWSVIAPAVWGIIAVLLVYNATMGIAWFTTLTDAIIKVWNTVVTWAQTAATIALAFAQGGLNAVVALGYAQWMVYAIVIIAIIAIFYGVIAAINHFVGTSISATGIIAGVFSALVTFLYNTFVYLANVFVTVAEFFANVFQNPVYSVRKLFANLVDNLLDMAISITGSFDNVATNIANAFVKGANMAIGAINWIIKALNKIPGVNLDRIGEMKSTSSITSSLQNLQGRVTDWAGDAPDDYVQLARFEMKGLDTAFDAGYAWGENLENSAKDFSLKDSLGDLFGLDNVGTGLLGNGMEGMFDDVPGLGGLGDADKAGKNLGKIADNTKDIKDNTGTGKEDLKYLRDLAVRGHQRNVINNIQFDMGGVVNNVSEMKDLDGVIDYIVTGVEKGVDASVEGVYG